MVSPLDANKAESYSFPSANSVWLPEENNCDSSPMFVSCR